MIDLFSMWMGGFLLSMVMNLIMVSELKNRCDYSALLLTVVAALWPVCATVVLVSILRKK